MKIVVICSAALFCLPLYGMNQHSKSSKQNNYVDISGLHKGKVLIALYEAAKPTKNESRLTLPMKCSKDGLQKILEYNSFYIHTLNTRVINAHLDKDAVNVESYNRVNGPGTAQKAIEQLRKQEVFQEKQRLQSKL